MHFMTYVARSTSQAFQPSLCEKLCNVAHTSLTERWRDHQNRTLTERMRIENANKSFPLTAKMTSRTAITPNIRYSLRVRAPPHKGPRIRANPVIDLWTPWAIPEKRNTTWGSEINHIMILDTLLNQSFCLKDFLPVPVMLQLLSLCRIQQAQDEPKARIVWIFISSWV